MVFLGGLPVSFVVMLVLQKWYGDAKVPEAPVPAGQKTIPELFFIGKTFFGYTVD